MNFYASSVRPRVFTLDVYELFRRDLSDLVSKRESGLAASGRVAVPRNQISARELPMTKLRRAAAMPGPREGVICSEPEIPHLFGV